MPTVLSTQFADVCVDLAREVADFESDLVVAVPTGGRHVAAAMLPLLPSEPAYAEVTARRPATLIKERLPVGILLNRMPEPLLWRLRLLEVGARERLLRTRHEPRYLDLAAAEELRRLTPHPQRVLVVDDTVDSGRTLVSVQAVVRAALPDAVVRSAVLTSTWRNPPVRPDYCLFDGTILRFPWSLDGGA